MNAFSNIRLIALLEIAPAREEICGKMKFRP